MISRQKILNDFKNNRFRLLESCPHSKIFVNNNILIKKYDEKVDVKSEYDNQCLNYNLLKKNKTLGCPKAFFFDEKTNILCMEYVDGVNLIKYMRERNILLSNKNNLVEVFDMLFKGLRDYYNELKRVKSTNFTDYDFVMRKFFDKNNDMLLRFNPKEKQIKDKQVIHGNLKLENILIDKKKRLYLIDYSYNLKSSIYLDLGKLIESMFSCGIMRFYKYDFFFLKKIKNLLLQSFPNEELLKYYMKKYRIYDLLNCREKSLKYQLLKAIYVLRWTLFR
ncbi:hypothetical protein HN419_00210 [Candidatus Woesearchaeota archaeon]|nr:hypothetical protein [Candidatus Woesearchaeota archaeon]MBT3538430.1 hypothetical protein [Candidatus Woesearchaeota archaeon]MBT4696993.1 hypothetical protein [Candidatus Woesearchaeota archaeon]MBT7106114.1 hypothetical protein [Candidatus Woesearchaeota archaeon]MBT7930988.1 hypothetical protein [Candidatus Woesearchaeota archaeon]